MTDGKVGAFLGIDLGATHMRAVLLDPRRSETRAARMATPPPARLEDALRALVARVGAGRAPVEALGLSRAADIDAVGRVTAWPSRPDYLGADLLAPLTRAVDPHTAAAIGHLDDGMAAALGEAARAGGEGDALCVLSLGTGLGIGIVSGGMLVETGDGAGTLGHLPLGLADRTCACGKTACLQATLIDHDIPDAAFTTALERARDWLTARHGTRVFVVSGGAAAARRSAILALEGFRMSAMPDYCAAIGAALHAAHGRALTAARFSASKMCIDIVEV